MTATRPLLRIIITLLLLALAPTLAARTIPYPVVFVHGLGEKPGRWEPLVPGLTALGLKSGGVITLDRLLSHPPPANYDPAADFFLVEFNDNEGGVEEQLRELRKVLARLKRDTGAEQFTLVGFSMGGLVSRAYLTRYTSRHYVYKLVTLGSPHQGSHWALFYELFHPVKDGCRDNRSLSAIAMCALVGTLEQALGLRLDSSALRDLAPARVDADGRPLNLIAELAVAPHPADVRYVSIVGAVDLPSDWDELARALESLGNELGNGEFDLSDDKARLLGLIRHLLGLVLQQPDWLGRGDGGVSAMSQDLALLPWFRDRITTSEIVAQAGVEVQRHAVRGLEHPLRVETIDTHHLAQPAAFNALYRAIADPPSLSLEDPSGWTWLDTVTLRGQLDDPLLQPDQLQLLDHAGTTLPVNAAFGRDRRQFRFRDIALQPGANKYTIRYGVDHGFGVTPAMLEQGIEIDYRPNRLVQVLYDQRRPLTGLAVITVLLAVLGVLRRRSGKQSRPDSDQPR